MSPPTRLLRHRRHSRTSSATTQAQISTTTRRPGRSSAPCGTPEGRRVVSVEQKMAIEIVRAPRGWRRVRGMAMRVGAFAIVELQRLRHDNTELFTRLVQPALWL